MAAVRECAFPACTESCLRERRRPAWLPGVRFLPEAGAVVLVMQLEESLAEMEQASAVAVVELERVALEEIANLQVPSPPDAHVAIVVSTLLPRDAASGVHNQHRDPSLA